MDDRQRLEAAATQRDALQADKGRIEGRLEAARADLSSVEAECRKRGVEPEKLPAAIDQLKKRYGVEITKIEDGVEKAKAALEPFLGEN